MKSVMMGAASLLKKQFIGDANLGFFPDNKDDRIITNAALTAAVGLTGGTMINPDAGWFKFMDKGKLLYVAKLPFRSGSETQVLESLGIRDGRKTIEIAGKTYKVRLLNGWNTAVAAMGAGNTSNHPATVDTEFSRLFYRLCKDGGMVGEDRWGEYTKEELGFSSNYAIGSGTLCMEWISTTYYLIRGATGLKDAHVGNFSGATQARGWRPVLELVA